MSGQKKCVKQHELSPFGQHTTRRRSSPLSSETKSQAWLGVQQSNSVQSIAPTYKYDPLPVPNLSVQDKQIIPGYDVAGTVITAPPASPFQPGDEVYAHTYPARPGNYRDFSIGRSVEMARKPHKLSWAAAASVPMSAVTAWQALYEHAGVARPS